MNAREALEDDTAASHRIGHHRCELLEHESLVGLLSRVRARVRVRVRVMVRVRVRARAKS